MSRTKKLLAALSIAGVTAGASVVLAGEAAAAEPAAAGRCSYTLYGNPPTGGSVSCTGVSGQYRVVIVCHDGINGVNYTVPGPYVSSPKTSRANCGAPQRQTVTKISSQLR